MRQKRNEGRREKAREKRDEEAGWPPGNEHSPSLLDLIPGNANLLKWRAEEETIPGCATLFTFRRLLPFLLRGLKRMVFLDGGYPAYDVAGW
jgi:hypothetical protein